MKKTISVLVIMSVILSFCVVDFASTDSSNASESNVILSISYSSNIVGITGMDGEGGEEDSAPESFFVTEDNHVYILDSNNSQILRFYNNSLIEKIKIDCAKSHMNDMIIADMYIFILLSNNIILKVNQDGTIQEEIDVSSYLRTEEIITKDTSLQITVGPESILYEDNCLKLFCGDGKVYNLTNTEASVEERNTGVNSEGFTAIAFSTSNIAFPSFCTPIAANKAATIKDYTIYYTSEVYYSAGTTIFDRRLYYTASDKIVKYVQLEQAQFTKPYRQYQIMTDGTVYQMITTESQLKIIKLKFSTDYSSTPSYIDSSNVTAATQVTTGNTAGTPSESVLYVSDPSTAIWRVQTTFNMSGHIIQPLMATKHLTIFPLVWFNLNSLLLFQLRL